MSSQTRRAYNSPRRREQAAATRSAILDAANRLFEDQGFAATSVPEIAADAGVALKTVYVVFASKSGILHALWDELLGGDSEPIPVADRPWYRELLAEPDPDAMLSLLARQSRVVKDRAGRTMLVIRDGAAVDADVADLWGRIEREFHEILGPVADGLAERGALAGGVDPRFATDILWSLNHPDLWRLLVVECGWTGDAYEDWLAETLGSQLLRPPAAPARRTTAEKRPRRRKSTARRPN